MPIAGGITIGTTWCGRRRLRGIDCIAQSSDRSVHQALECNYILFTKTKPRKTTVKDNGAMTSIGKITFDSACVAGILFASGGKEAKRLPAACATDCTSTLILCSMIVCTASRSLTNVSHLPFYSYILGKGMVSIKYKACKTICTIYTCKTLTSAICSLC